MAWSMMNSLAPYIEEFHLLTPQQLNYVVNGCGPKFGKAGLIVPDFGGLYSDACLLHDWIYWSGGSQHIRLLADKRLKDDMKSANNSLSWWKRWLLAWAPQVYYSAVRLLGDSTFYEAPERRTRLDLEMEMKDAEV
jgi:hypothetical protein